MNPVVAFLKAVRWPNLVIVILTMFLVREAIIYTFFNMLHSNEEVLFSSGLSDNEFYLLVLSSVLIAAAGNLINDYFDLKIDRINKPDKIIVGRHIKRRVAMLTHMVFSGVAMLIAGYLAYRAGVIELAFIQAILVATLWFYSTDFKRRLIWGNLAIGFCVALIPLVVWTFEIVTMLNANQDLFTEMKYKAVFKEFSEITLYWMLGLSLFFFLVTLAREITKDIVDMKGDAAFRCKTMPIVLGISKTKWVVVALYLITIGLLIFAKEQYLNNKITAIYFYLLLTPLLGVIIALTIKGKSPEQFKLPSTLNKVTSVIGVLFLVIAYMELNGLW